ncbi:MAG: adenylate kinase [Actinomycetota bacterium]|nr:adenylate kinase [Actinomycetota bacterium]
MCRSSSWTGVFHQANWTPLPPPEFRAVVHEAVLAYSWVVDGNYTGTVGDLVLARADTVVWFDLPRHVVMRQIVWRTVRRIVTCEELWNGNRERLRNFFSLDEEESVIVWAWATHAMNRERLLVAQTEPAYQRLRLVRLRSRRQMNDFIDVLYLAPT